MPYMLNLLMLEDNPLDAELIIKALEEAGLLCRWDCVETQENFILCLDTGKYDLILSDYNLPSFDGISALHVFIERKLDIPFILISGAIGEETAIESLKAGATDYVLKDHLPRLAPVVKRALQEKEELRLRKRVEEEKAALQEQLRQSQKMEAIGQLAGGIAHDFNNLLTVIQGYSEIALLSLKQTDPLRNTIIRINEAGMKAANLTHQLLAFSRRQVLEMKVVDLNETIRELNNMLRRMIGEDIELITLQQKDLWHVKVDPRQIDQVIINLAVNARDAMPTGGRLTIETANVYLDTSYTDDHVAIFPGPHVMLSVSDTGMGISPEIMDRIFEPFFTTKERGKGTGLGLSTIYGIINQCGGNIRVYSKPDQGTTFKIYLPQALEASDELKNEASPVQCPRGNETILVVEDDADAKRLTVEILEMQGYLALEAFDGNEALNIAKAYEGNIHLVLTDVVMPQMSGKEMVDHLRMFRPDIKVLFMSGYTDNAIVHHGILYKGLFYIQKPFTIDGLSQKIREVLDNNQAI
jgi:two-component system, cell cycle sensor histidine kinase and response regulator CckA